MSKLHNQTSQDHRALISKKVLITNFPIWDYQYVSETWQLLLQLRQGLAFTKNVLSVLKYSKV